MKRSAIAARAVCSILAVMELAGPAGAQRGASSAAEFVTDLPRVRRVDRLASGAPMNAFATFGQCQIELSVKGDPSTALALIPDEYAPKIERCLEAAAREQVDVLVLPELALAFREPTRAALLTKIRGEMRRRDAITIAGSYYDAKRQSRLPVIGRDWEELGYKIRPSRFEVSPRHGQGMTAGTELILVRTRFGRLLPLTCVDLISDAVQYAVRSLATRGEVDALVSVNFNPAAWEFLIEANSVVRRHPIFVSITNVASAADPALRASCEKTGDTGYCYGNSALFASLRDRDSDCPDCARSIADLVPAPFKSNGVRALAYDTLVASLPPFQEAMLVYDVNLRLTREPAVTNAPDQGYPPVRNVRIVSLGGGGSTGGRARVDVMTPRNTAK